jgi:hypothetical protein
MNWSKRLLSFAIFLAGVGIAVGADKAEVAAGDRVLQFVLNVHTGVAMKPKEWLSPEVRKAPMFVGFGGLPAMIRQTTANAHEYGGISGMHIKSVRVVGSAVEIVVKVRLRDEHLRKQRGEAADLEGSEWGVTARKYRGVWLIASV